MGSLQLPQSGGVWDFLHCSASFGPLASHPVVLCLMKNPSRYPRAYLLLPAGSAAERLPDTHKPRGCSSSEEVISTLCGVDHLGLYLHHHSWKGDEEGPQFPPPQNPASLIKPLPSLIFFSNCDTQCSNESEVLPLIFTPLSVFR